MKNKVGAFTLIELSIVLVIISMLISGVLVGRSLLRQSEVNAAMADARNYIAATQSFQQKYNALPGDMANATDYWGIAAGSSPYTSTCYTGTVGTAPATCNGNGDGQINTTGTYMNESLRVWQHLSAAGFISGIFTGQARNFAIAGTNSPAAKLSNLTFQIAWQGTSVSDTYVFDGNYGHVIYVGGSNSAGYPYKAVFTGLEAQSLDSKFDDGSPTQGSIRTFKNGAYTLTCASSTAVTATYSTANTSTCSLLIITGF